jgi:hypothetical protein
MCGNAGPQNQILTSNRKSFKQKRSQSDVGLLATAEDAGLRGKY